jgi:dTDP-4-dehydrorhamnose reductase
MIDKASRYLILGKNGMLGKDLQKAFHDRDFVALGHDELDIADEEALKTAILTAQPDVVINATGYKNVDKAESEEEKANLINGYAVGAMARICRDFGITLVHFSTDYVFDGQKQEGYKETDSPRPINAYGRSKLLGEELLIEAMEADFGKPEEQEGQYFIVRAPYFFGSQGSNLLSRMLENARNKVKFKAVNDQYARPTYTLDLARQVKWLLESNEYESGIYHITNSGTTNWYELAKALVEEAGFVSDLVEPCSRYDWPAAAERPQYSVLLNNKLPELRPWREALKEYLDDLKAI